MYWVHNELIKLVAMTLTNTTNEVKFQAQESKRSKTRRFSTSNPVKYSDKWFNTTYNILYSSLSKNEKRVEAMNKESTCRIGESRMYDKWKQVTLHEHNRSKTTGNGSRVKIPGRGHELKFTKRKRTIKEFARY